MEAENIEKMGFKYAHLFIVEIKLCKVKRRLNSYKKYDTLKTY